MDSLGPYVLHAPILPGGLLDTEGRVLEAWLGRDSRTGIGVVVYRPLEGEPPEAVAGMLPWLEGLESAWIAEIPVAAVEATRFQGTADPKRLLAWARGLLETLGRLQEAGLSHGNISAERLWVRGPRIWLEGAGLPVQPVKPDPQGVVEALRQLAGESWSHLLFSTELEAFAQGKLSLEEVRERLAGEPVAEAEAESPAILQAVLEEEPTLAVRSTEEPPPPSAPVPKSKSQLRVESQPVRLPEGSPEEEMPVAPRRIRIEDPLEPSFPVIEPQPHRRSLLHYLGVLLLVVAVGLAVWLWPRPQPVVSGYVVEFRLDPPEAKGRIEILEAPPGSTMEKGRTIAEVPGPVQFDKAGAYRVRIRVDGREPKEVLLDVPTPGGVTIRLQ
ncbi:hypothetical protein [Calidithermus roseus]|uniref:hypothetical protein n=1 Tax=Calidithermus roseus TaxID=1644118 RepID=UPI000E65A5AF|nr:hypothetical protein [Calidithermus roseus]